MITPTTKGRSLWSDAILRLKKNRVALVCLAIIILYALVAILSKLGWLAPNWNDSVGASYGAPELFPISRIFGMDLFGRSVLYKVIHGTRIAMILGLVASLISIPVGVFFGAVAGYFGGLIDEWIVWFYTTISSIPNIMLLIAISYVMGKGIFAVYIALGATSWVGLARVIRGEFIKHKSREYVIAASAIGATHTSRIFKHILPNVSHQVILNLSIQFQFAIRSEVILSYLGLGVQGQPSWGVMIDDAKLELARGVWWQLAGASFGMFFIILTLNIFGDALRDALDPKLK